MPFVRVGGSKLEKIQLALSAGASGSARHQGDASPSAGSCSGSGSYTLSRMFITKLVGISGSMSVRYTNSQGVVTNTSISAGREITIENNRGVTISWSGSKSYENSGIYDASGGTSGAVVVDVYF